MKEGGSLNDGGGPAGVVDGFEGRERRLLGVEGGSEEPGTRNILDRLRLVVGRSKDQTGRCFWVFEIF